MQRPIVDETGQEKGMLEIPEELMGVAPRPHLWWQVAVAETANRRRGTSSTKTRSEVRGGGAKPWRQKGTGRARAGSTRAPQWKGGGASHGPRPRSYEKEIPKRQRRMAFYELLTERLRAGETVVVDSLQLPAGKTREMVRLLGSLIPALGHDRSSARHPKTLIVLDGPQENLLRAAGNLPNVQLRLLHGVALSDLLAAERLIFTRQAAEQGLKEARKWLVKPTG